MIVQTSHLTRRYGNKNALDDVNLELSETGIYGLLGRNGAGKTTLMSILSAQEFASEGSVRVFGENPVENTGVLERICFVRENQRYPEEANPARVFKSAELMYPEWDEDLAQTLKGEFDIPLRTPMKKLSRGQLSAVGVVLGLASHSPLTFFDEPYLGLDAVARRIFYRHLAQDISDHPRTVIISSHLIDEIANLIGHVLVLDQGRLVLDMSTQEVNASGVTLTGPTALAEEFVAGKRVIGRETLGGVSRLTLFSQLDPGDLERAESSGLEISGAPLQEVVVDLVESRKEGN